MGVDPDDGVSFWFDDQPSPPRDIPLDRVGATQWDLDQAKVDRIKESWSDDMPAPIVAEMPHRDGGVRYPIGDGHHRIAAAIQLGKKTIKAQVIR
jgi:ParB-like chromosome segregation protein Spo0J